MVFISGCVRTIGKNDSNDHSTLLSAPFALGDVEHQMLANQGSNVNLVPINVSKLLKVASLKLLVHKRTSLRVYTSVDESAKIIFKKRFVAYI